MNDTMNCLGASSAHGQPIRLKFWRGIAWLLVILVVVLSVLPTSVPPGFDGGDKLQHLLAYAVLGFFFAVLYPRHQRLALLGLILLGALLEWVQGLLPVRVASLPDWLADALGVLLGIWLAQSRARALFAWLEQKILMLAMVLGRRAHRRN
ncbi:putative integral membrane protein [Thiorhodovibrio winogradskyi]|uniref:Integral membrane protein n=1 Tax=Thiorhodovibrio winogradskyi TaxID=77007 RepID=A0ABZ0S5B3_9GAMM|nr:VanZ family protein [Thiorhodovibrio winogradskyi]